VSFSAANGLVVFGLLRGNNEGWGSPARRGLPGRRRRPAGRLRARQVRVRQPMLPLRLFGNLSFTGAQIGAFAISGSMFALFLYITLYLQNIVGQDALDTGLI
jgi:hypothetical protein